MTTKITLLSLISVKYWYTVAIDYPRTHLSKRFSIKILPKWSCYGVNSISSCQIDIMHSFIIGNIYFERMVYLKWILKLLNFRVFNYIKISKSLIITGNYYAIIYDTNCMMLKGHNNPQSHNTMTNFLPKWN